jgi:hypothetical protein
VRIIVLDVDDPLFYLIFVVDVIDSSSMAGITGQEVWGFCRIDVDPTPHANIPAIVLIENDPVF